MKGKKPENYERLVKAVLLALMFAAGCFIVRGGNRMVSSVSTGKFEIKEKLPCVVIDAGHGSGNLRKVTKGKEIQKERQPLSLILQLNKS